MIGFERGKRNQHNQWEVYALQRSCILPARRGTGTPGGKPEPGGDEAVGGVDLPQRIAGDLLGEDRGRRGRTGVLLDVDAVDEGQQSPVGSPARQ
jgi:hypothetical protein